MTDLWQTLRASDRPILLYGMGDGADKVLAVCESKGIAVSGVFASDGFARGNDFHGMPVTNYQTACENFGRFIVLRSFATRREEVLSNVERIAREQTLYVPDVPVVGENLFDADFYEIHKEKFDLARSLLADELSRKVFDCVIAAKLTGELAYLQKNTTTDDEDFSSVLHPGNYRVCGDFGAYDGDTARDLLRRNPKIETVVALESDRKTFLRLQKKTEGSPVRAFEGAAWDREETLLFSLTGGRGSGGAMHGKKTLVRALPVDRLFDDLRADYLKFDVEGAELRALKGAAGTIDRDRPEMLISCYHRAEDLFALPLYLHERHPFYKLYLRRRAGVPAWDVNLYAVT